MVAASDSEIDLVLQPKTAAQLSLTGYALKMFPYANAALVNAAAGKPVGQPHALLYAHPDAFNDVRTGDNKASGIGYAAGAGWDACTGLGTPRAAAVAALFAAKAT